MKTKMTLNFIKIIKNKIILIFFITNIYNISAQEKINFDTIALIDRAYLYNNILYNQNIINVNDSINGLSFSDHHLFVTTISIRITEINGFNKPKFTITDHSYNQHSFINPFIWDVISDTTFGYLSVGLSSSSYFTFYNDPLMQKDTSQLIKESMESWQAYERGEITYDEMYKLDPYGRHKSFRNRREVNVLRNYFDYYTLPFVAIKFETMYNKTQKSKTYWKARNVT